MNGSTATSRVALKPEKLRTRRAARSEPWTPQRLRSAGSYWQARILATAAHLELFDWLGKRPRSARTATKYFGGTQEGWKTFLDALSAMGLLKKRIMSYENSSFALRYLCSGKGSFLLSDYDAWDVWGKLAGFLTTGKRPKSSQPFFTDREQTQRLLHSLDQDARKIAPYLMARLPLSRSKTLLDVGGGFGSFAIECCQRFPQLQATVVEHPRVAIFTSRAVKKAKMAKQVQVVALDIVKDPLPRGFDLVLVSNVLHGQGVRESRALLRSAYRCLNQGGRIVLRDVLMNRAGTDPDWGALFSVALFLHTPNGRCYALDEVRGWLRAAGFSGIKGPFRSSPLAFDPDFVLIAEKS
jgi:cyclopropane fatty-acyl-phospholipid synthase-like methyltransferase